MAEDKKLYPFRFSEEVNKMLEEIAKANVRSKNSQIEILIREAHKALFPARKKKV